MHNQEGTPQPILQELGGWSSPEMVQKYAHLSSEYLVQWVGRNLTWLQTSLKRYVYDCS